MHFSFYMFLSMVFALIIVIYLYRRFLFKKNKFYVVIDWGEKIGYEYSSAVGWRANKNLLTLYKQGSEEIIVLDKTQKAVIFKMSSDFDAGVKIDVFNPVFSYMAKKENDAK